MHFSSIIITNTGWLLDKPRERARAKKTHSRPTRSTTSLYLESAQAVRVSSLFVVPRARTMVINPVRIGAHTHKRASTHNTMDGEYERKNSDRLEFKTPAYKVRAYNCWRCARPRTLGIYIPEIVRNVLSTYSILHMCELCVCVCVSVYMFTYVYV